MPSFFTPEYEFGIIEIHPKLPETEGIHSLAATISTYIPETAFLPLNINPTES